MCTPYSLPTPPAKYKLSCTAVVESTVVSPLLPSHRLPPFVRVRCLRHVVSSHVVVCRKMEKDVHAYLFCATYPGRTLIFVNAISIARRLSVLLCSLNVPATPLHAQMQQRQRLKSLVSATRRCFFFVAHISGTV